MENGYFKLTWRQRIGFSAGDLAQNLIYQTVSIWLLFFYTNVYGLAPASSAVMFLVVRIIDVIWDPVVGAFIDKANPPWGKYRSWLLFAGFPLAGFAILCFWNGFSGSLLYAYITYVGMSMCFTLINVPYGALNSSLTRDTEEITILTSVRMLFANLAGLIIKTLPLVIAIFAPKAYNETTGRMEAVYNTPEAAPAWFITMSIFALVGLALLIFCFVESKERIVMDADERSAALDGEEISLTAREFDLLYKLLSYPKKTFTRTQLMDEFWDVDTQTSTRTVDVYMTKLRAKLSDCDSFEIQTVHGLGYKAVIK